MTLSVLEQQLKAIPIIRSPLVDNNPINDAKISLPSNSVDSFFPILLYSIALMMLLRVS